MKVEKGVYVTFDELLGLQERSRAISDGMAVITRNMLQGNRPSKERGRGGAFDQIRNYMAGDDVRNIDWNVTARMGKPYVRVFNEERESPLIVLVDQSSDMFFATRKQMKSVVAAKIAAYLLWMAHNRKRPSGAVILGDETLGVHRPRSNQGHLQGVLNQIVEYNQNLSADEQGKKHTLSFNDALQRLNQVVSKDAFVVLISDFLHIDDESWQLIERLRLRSNVIATPIYDGTAESLPSEGNFLARYANYQAELNFSNTTARAHISQGAKGRIDSLKQRLSESGIPTLMFTTYGDVEQTLVSGLFIGGA